MQGRAKEERKKGVRHVFHKNVSDPFLLSGMLPKLKELNKQAKKRRVAYVLVTNLIGCLDEAAVREGRFDEKKGIYPPDILSRVGRFVN